MHMIRKGQYRRLKKGNIAGQIHFVNRAFGIAAYSYYPTLIRTLILLFATLPFF